MRRLRGICLLAFCLLAFCLLAVVSGCARPEPRDLNVVLVSYDTLRADHLGLYGYARRDTSPVLDRLAQRGVVFERAVSQASSTFPSHMSLFQSRWASQISKTSPMLAQVLRRRGFRTAAFTNGGNVSAKLGFERGFDSYYETRSQRGLEELMPRFESWVREHEESRREENGSEPFFVFLHTYDIHHPYDPPKEFQQQFDDGYAGRITGASTGPLLNKVRRIHNFSDFEGEVRLSDADKAHVQTLYDADIRHADGYLQRLDDLLTELRLWDDTLVILLSDHGEEFWEHGQVLHSFTVYEEMVHVPLVMWLPASEHMPASEHIEHTEPAEPQAVGVRIPHQVRLLDVAPTVLELLEIEAPAEMQGESLLPLIRDEGAGAGADRPAVAEMNRRKAWIEPPHKLIVDHDSQELRYYHLGDDPGEQDPRTEGRMPRELYRRLIETLGHSVARPVSGPAQMELPEDDELLDQLRALGYID